MGLERERIVRVWFGMWLSKDVSDLEALFAPEAFYSESWGPEYRGTRALRRWFLDWCSRGTVEAWEIKQFLHQGNGTAVEWYFRYSMSDGTGDAFDGVSLIEWDGEGRIASLKEFASKLPHCDPYA